MGSVRKGREGKALLPWALLLPIEGSVGTAGGSEHPKHLRVCTERAWAGAGLGREAGRDDETVPVVYNIFSF